MKHGATGWSSVPVILQGQNSNLLLHASFTVVQNQETTWFNLFCLSKNCSFFHGPVTPKELYPMNSSALFSYHLIIGSTGIWVYVDKSIYLLWAQAAQQVPSTFLSSSHPIWTESVSLVYTQSIPSHLLSSLSRLASDYQVRQRCRTIPHRLPSNDLQNLVQDTYLQSVK